jgi:putative ABC transport system permease protein
MTSERLVNVSERWFRLLQRLYPPDFRDEMGDAVVETYRDRARDLMRRRGGLVRLAVLWMSALADSLRNGPGERARPAVSWRRGGNWGRDIETATRRLRRAPAFAAATIGTLTIGLGMVAVVYTIVDKILLEPMPYRDAGDLYYVWRDYGTIIDLKRGSLAGPDVAELRKSSAAIDDVAAMEPFLGGIFALREGGDPSEIAVTVTTPNLFHLLGVTPMLGRDFAPNESGRGHPNVIMLTYGLWNRIGADPALVGSQVRLQGNAYTVIGVLPPTFALARNDAAGAPQRIEAFTTLDYDPATARPDRGSLSAIVRARPGVSPEVVASAVDVVGRAIDARDFGSRGLRFYPVGLKADLVARVRPVLLVLAAAGALLAIMLTVNLASVLLARAAQREHEFAVTRALGASDRAVMSATLFEGGLLGLCGGASGALVAIWATRLLVALAPQDLPRRDAIAVDWTIAVAVIALGFVLGLLAATGPAIWSTRTSLAALLASSNVRGGGGHGRLRRGMIVAQVAFSLVLLSTGALVARSVEQLLRADPGFRAEHVLTFRVRSPPEFFPKPADLVGFQNRVEQALAALPGVVGVSATSSLPLTASAPSTGIEIPGAPGNSGSRERDGVLVDMIGTRASYVQVMGMRVIAGRAFDPVRIDGRQEVLIDRRLAAQFFANRDPIGTVIPRGGSRVSARLETAPASGMTIVGVVDQARLYDVQQDGRPQIYLRTEDWGYRPLSYVVRTEGDPELLIPAARAALRQIEPRVAMGDVKTMDQIVNDLLRQQRTGAVLVAAFAVGALLLVAMGLFGVMSSSVTRRQHEMAVRLALGADHGRVLRLVLGEGASLVAIGVLVGVPGVYAIGHLIRGILVGISPLDPLTLAIAAIGLAAVTLAACYVPARRVLRIDPTQSLRQG